MKNPYEPIPTSIAAIDVENDVRDIKSFKLVFCDKKQEDQFSFLPGQFAELSIFGYGESPIGIASSPTENGHLLFTVKRAGLVTTRLHQAVLDETVGIRGPLGNTYPFEKMKKKNILIISGGFAFTTLRSTIKYILDPSNRPDYRDLTVIYGARNPGELLYKNELWEWEKRDDLTMHITVDKGDASWTRREGFVPIILKDVAPSSKDTLALVCGPPIMLKFTLPILVELGFPADSIYMSLEMRMKCGIGKCGRCNIGHKYVCKHGPVFSSAELEQLPPEF
jgi:sulfhydrogenase subunit gamma (sulfur reductase)